MMNKLNTISVLLLIIPYLQNGRTQSTYSIPNPKIEVFSPRGLRVSIPDTQGIQLFGFHAKINSAFSGIGSSTEPGQIDIDTLKPTSGLWIVEDDSTQLEIGDTIYYWMFVQYNQLGFRKENGRFEVKGLLNKNGQVVVGSTEKPGTDITAECEPTATTVNGAFSCRGKLIFSEDFNTNKVDNKKWTIENRIPYYPDNVFVTYQRKQENVFVEGGNLNIVPTLITDPDYVNHGVLNLTSSCTGRAADNECYKAARSYFIMQPVTSARLNSLPYFSFLYGKVEIRAKIPAGDWLFPEIYLLPKDYEYGPGYESGKIWVAFSRGNQQYQTYEQDLSSKVLFGGYILGQNEPLKSLAVKSKASRSSAWNEDFHTYTLIWRPEGITVAVDSETYGVITIPNGGFKTFGQQYDSKHTRKWTSTGSPFDKEFYIVLGVAVGGTTDFPEAENKPWRNRDPKLLIQFWNDRNKWHSTWQPQSSRMQVDYIKVWAI